LPDSQLDTIEANLRNLHRVDSSQTAQDQFKQFTNQLKERIQQQYKKEFAPLQQETKELTDVELNDHLYQFFTANRELTSLDSLESFLHKHKIYSKLTDHHDTGEHHEEPQGYKTTPNPIATMALGITVLGLFLYHYSKELSPSNPLSKFTKPWLDYFDGNDVEKSQSQVFYDSLKEADWKYMVTWDNYRRLNDVYRYPDTVKTFVGKKEASQNILLPTAEEDMNVPDAVFPKDSFLDSRFMGSIKY
jgi:hypothetical protein